MRKIRKRARRPPSLVWACAHARLEDRLLLSGATYATYQGPIPAPAAVPSSDSVPSFQPAGDLIGGFSSAAADGGGVPSPQADVGDLSLDPSGGLPLGPITIGSAVGSDIVSPSIGEKTTGGTAPASSIGGSFLAEMTGPGDLSVDPSGGGAPLGPFSIVPAERAPLNGEAAGLRSEVIEAGVGPMVIYFYSYNPSGADGLVFPLVSEVTSGAAAPIGGGKEGEAPDLADPPPVPQPTAPLASPIRLFRVPEAAEADPDGPPAVEDEPASARPPAAPEAPAPEVTPPAEAPTDPIAAGLRLTAPLVDVAGWDEALGRLVEGVDDLAAGLHDLGATPATLPWVVAAGLMLVASEAARRARPRPRLAAAFVDGSASVVDPADDPSRRPRALPLSGSVRRLVARGLSRWTTRR